MLQRLEALIGCDVAIPEGRVGVVKDVLFDREKWAVRHLVVDTGNWLTGNQVLISPIAVKSIDVDEGTMTVGLTRQQIEEAPSIAEDQPVSRQYESSYYTHYGWAPYWNGPMLWGYWGAPGVVSAEPPRNDIEAELEARAESLQDENLHSFKAVNGYAIEATDGKMGDIEDMIIDDETWKLHYIVVDTSKLLPSKDVLVPLESVKSILYNGSTVTVDMTKEALKNQPVFTSVEELSRLQDRGAANA